jgi:hypothetical protein
LKLKPSCEVAAHLLSRCNGGGVIDVHRYAGSLCQQLRLATAVDLGLIPGNSACGSYSGPEIQSPWRKRSPKGCSRSDFVEPLPSTPVGLTRRGV